MKYTVLGAGGFIGSHLLHHLKSLGKDCHAPGKSDSAVFSEHLGHVFYCIGLTADFRERPLNTVRAHVCVLADLLERARFESLLYLSSTRVYANSSRATEDVLLGANTESSSDYYNLTKMTGESLCFASGRAGVQVARLSNVYGADLASSNFLASVIRDAIDRGEVKLGISLNSEKDYVSVNDVVRLLPAIAEGGKERIYNVAAGRNISNRELFGSLSKITGCRVGVAEGALTVRYPVIDIGRVQREFGFAPAKILDELQGMVGHFRKERT